MIRFVLALIVLLLTVSTSLAQTPNVTGSITASTPCPGAACVQLTDLQSAETVGVDVTGAWTGTLEFRISVDGTNWRAVQALVLSGETRTTTATSNGIYVLQVGGVTGVRVLATAWTSGSATVTINAGTGLPPVIATSTNAPGGLTDAELRATPVPVSGTVSVQQLGNTQVGFGSISFLEAWVNPVGGRDVSTTNYWPIPLSGDGTAVPVSGTFWQATQPVSAASLPLPTGAATSAAQTTGNASLSSIDTKTPALVGGRQPVETTGQSISAIQSTTDLALGEGWLFRLTDSNALEAGIVNRPPETGEAGLITRNYPYEATTFGTIDMTSTACPGSGCVTLTTASDKPLVFVNITGTFTGDLSAQVSVDGSEWFGTSFYSFENDTYESVLNSAPQRAVIPMQGAKYARVIGSGSGTGSAVVTLSAGTGNVPSHLDVQQAQSVSVIENILLNLSAVGTLTSTACPGAGCVTLSNIGSKSMSVATVQIEGTFTASIVIEITLDGTIWRSVAHEYTNGSGVESANVGTIQSPGIYRVKVGGANGVRVRAAAISSGTAAVDIRLGNGDLGSGLSQTVLQAGASATATGKTLVVGGFDTGAETIERLPLSSSATPTGLGLVTRNIPTGTQTISGSVTVTSASNVTLIGNSAVNLNQVNGNGVSTGNGIVAAGTQRVTIANDSTGVLASIGSISTSVTPGTAAANLGKAEDTAHTTGDVGVLTFGVRKDDAAIVTTNNGGYAPQAMDAYGAAFMRLDHPNRFICTMTSTAVTSTVITGCTAPGAGLARYITDIHYSSSIISTTANFMTIQYGTGSNCGTGTTVVWRMFNSAAFLPVIAPINTPIKIGTNTDLCFLHPGAGTRLITITGFIAQ